ncbi:phage tail tape measure protein [Fusobacterium ulcerans]|uniref:Phage tail tape measure protein, TP901 family, core region n=1 Tax=Fusobacterium ulcerans 12-1B TaxID=457404 RepID=H1PVT7_9FUSO|nr:phage tail tape measure protein [Fusobacterium ulcerans]EHO79791.2 phage tail tape measure protein, TP901 family, core region [Fusobacterium ulcerans 12-1B]
MAGKIAGMFFEIDYKVNPEGVVKGKVEFQKFGKEAKKASEEINFVEKGMGNLIGKAAGIVSVGYAFKKTSDFIGQSVATYVEFDDSLRKTGSKLNLTNFEMKSLAKSTGEVALQFNTTGKAVSDAQEYLALAGYNLKEIQAASGTVVAAQRATGESMQLVSDIATDTASSYGYMADELNFVTDRMVYTTTAFNTNFAQMGDAMKYVAPVAKNAGIEFADLNAYIGVAANSGIKASQAGTALRAMFLKIQAPVGKAAKLIKRNNIELYDSNGKFKGVNNVLGQMEKKMGTMTEKQKAFFMQQVFGTEAMSTANIIFKEGIDNVIAYGDAIDGATGKTAAMAKYMDADIGGLTRSLKSEEDAIKRTLGDAFEPVAWKFVEILRDGTKGIREGLEKEETKSTITKIGLGAFEMAIDDFESVGNGIKYVGKVIDTVTLGVAGKSMQFLKSNPSLLVGRYADMYSVGEKELLAQTKQREYLASSVDRYNMFYEPSNRKVEYLTNSLLANGGFLSKEERNRTEEKFGYLSLSHEGVQERIDRTYYGTKEKPVVNFTLQISGGEFKDKENIELLSKTMEEKFQEMIDTSWNKKLSMEDLLINGR